MHLSKLDVAPELAPLMPSAWLCDDEAGRLAGEPLRVTPHIGTVLCLQLGADVATEFACERPKASLNGIQDCIRSFLPLGAARSVLVFLTPRGVARLFPSEGAIMAGNGVDLGALIGDGEVDRLRRAASAAPDDAALSHEIADWMRRRIAKVGDGADAERFAIASERLCRDGATVADVAASVSLSVRQLERAFGEQLGIAPKRFQRIHRLQRSLHAALTGRGDPLAGFADQAHQIRNWRAFLDRTPGEMDRLGISPVGSRFLSAAAGPDGGLAHYL